ncbi:MAG: hypothetical protein LBL85_00865 [Methanocalculaceae archaeon]|jgi:hypothetical protein|nr:hypothetical protein [Methanocalculaceae archaeon]
MVNKRKPNCEKILGMGRYMSNGDGRKSGGWADVIYGKNLATSMRMKKRK